MYGEIFIDVALPGDLKRRQLDQSQDVTGKHVAKKIPGILFIGEHGVKKLVVG
jgi:hypothetical protein